MNYSSDIRSRKTSKNIGENTSVDYDVTNTTGQPVREIDGSIRKNAERVGRLNINISGDNAYICLEKFSSLSHQERKEVLSAISGHLEEILTGPIEEEQA